MSRDRYRDADQVQVRVAETPRVRACWARFPGGFDLEPHEHETPVMAVALRGAIEEVFPRATDACGPATVFTQPAGERHRGRVGRQRPNYVGQVVLGRWWSFQLTYFFDAATFTADFREEYRTAIAEGIRRWDQATENDLGAVVVVEDRNEADFRIIFGPVAAPEVPAGTTFGSSRPFLDGGVIAFNAPFMEEGERLVRTGQLPLEVFGRVVARLAAHEMGHLLGISGHPDGDDTLMGFSSPVTLERPTTADVNTITHAYCR